MHLHHPEIAKDWEKKYKDGGFVEEAKEASVQGDVVDAKLTPKETILNWEHMQALQEYVGEPIEKVFQKIGLPGFETGEFQAKGGGVATKKDYLMKYQDSGVAMSKEDTEKRYGSLLHRLTTKLGGDTSDFTPEGGYTKDYYQRTHGTQPDTLSFTDPGNYRFNFPTGTETATGAPPLEHHLSKTMRKAKVDPFERLDWATKLAEVSPYRGGGVAKKEYLAGYKHGGVEHGDGSDILDIIRNISQRERFSKERPGVGELTYKPQREYYTKAAEMAIEDFDWDKKAKKYRYGGAAKKTKKKKQLMSYY